MGPSGTEWGVVITSFISFALQGNKMFVEQKLVNITSAHPKLSLDFGVERLDQKVWTVTGAKNILNFYVSLTNRLKKDVKCCYDYSGPILIRTTPPIWEHNLRIDKRGIRVRFLTEVRAENLQYCKKMLEEIKHLEMRHMDGVKGNFTLLDDKEYFLPFFVGKIEEPESRNALYCTQKEMVEAHLFMFESLWRQATPAQLRIKELEEGIKPDFIETIRDSLEIQQHIFQLIKSAKEELLLLFSTPNAFYRQVQMGIIQTLNEAASNHGVNVRILIHSNDGIKDTLEKLKRNKEIKVLELQTFLQMKLSIVIQDRKFSLEIEVKDDTKSDISEATGLATYSNSESTVWTQSSIFETLWTQSELHSATNG